MWAGCPSLRQGACPYACVAVPCRACPCRGGWGLRNHPFPSPTTWTFLREPPYQTGRAVHSVASSPPLLPAPLSPPPTPLHWVGLPSGPVARGGGVTVRQGPIQLQKIAGKKLRKIAGKKLRKIAGENCGKLWGKNCGKLRENCGPQSPPPPPLSPTLHICHTQSPFRGKCTLCCANTSAHIFRPSAVYSLALFQFTF